MRTQWRLSYDRVSLCLEDGKLNIPLVSSITMSTVAMAISLLGYNVPGYEYLWHDGSHFLLKMRIVDHIFDEQLVDHMSLRIILPEGAQ